MPKNVKVRVMLKREATFDQTIEMPAADYERLLGRLYEGDREVGEEIFEWLRPDDFDWADAGIDPMDVDFELARPKRKRRT